MRVFYFPKEEAWRALRRWAREVTASHPEVERVLLFGSLARGTPAPGSDADVLLVLTDSDLPLTERMLKYLPSSLPVPVEVFPYTRQEIEQMQGEGNPFLRRALAEAVDLLEGEAPS